MKLRRGPIFWLDVTLVLPALVSLGTGLRHGLERGQDFQWSGAHLLAVGVDPYREFLQGDPGHRILLAQVPNYLQELYVLLLPVGELRFETARVVWLLVNLALLAGIVALLRRMYALPAAETSLLLLLTLLSAPLRIALGNGQQSLLELLFFCLVFGAGGMGRRGLALGLSYAKYSFAPVLVLYLLGRRRFGLLLISVVPVAVGLVAMWARVHGSLPTLATEPLAVSKTGVTAGLGDGMSLVWAAAHGRLSPAVERRVMDGVGLLLSAACALYVSRQTKARDVSRQTKARDVSRQTKARDQGEGVAAAMLAVASLLCLTHLTYDYVFLMVPMAAGLSEGAGRWGRWVAALVGVLWILLGLTGRVPDARIPVLQVAVFVTLAGMFLMTGEMARRPKQTGGTAWANGGRSPAGPL